MLSSISRLFRKLRRRSGSPLKIPSDQDLADVLFLFYQEKIFSNSGESRMLIGDSAQLAFENVRNKMGISSEDLVRMIGILNTRRIIEAKIAHESSIIECQHIKLGFSALSFVQETAARRRAFWVNSVFLPVLIAFVTAYFTVALAQSPEQQTPQNSTDQRPTYFVSGSRYSHPEFIP